MNFSSINKRKNFFITFIQGSDFLTHAHALTYYSFIFTHEKSHFSLLMTVTVNMSKNEQLMSEKFRTLFLLSCLYYVAFVCDSHIFT